MGNNWPQGKLTDDQWMELLGIEYTLIHYPSYYPNNKEYNKAVDRLHELRQLKH